MAKQQTAVKASKKAATTDKKIAKAKKQTAARHFAFVKGKKPVSAIEKAFAKMEGKSHCVWVALKDTPKNAVGYVEAIAGEVVSVGDEEKCDHFDYPLNMLVLWDKPPMKKAAKSSKRLGLGDYVRVRATVDTKGHIKEFGIEDSITITEETGGQSTWPVQDIELLMTADKVKAANKRMYGIMIDDAKKQHEGYAKVASKLVIGTPILELNGKHRNGRVASLAQKGSGHVECYFAQEVVDPNVSPFETKHVGDFRVLRATSAELRRNKDAVRAARNRASIPAIEQWAIGAAVVHPTHGNGIVCGHTKTDGVVEVNFDLESAADVYDARGIAVEGIEIVGDELKSREPKKAKKLRFADVNLFEAFVAKDRTHVKVGNTSAIAVAVAGIESEPFAMLATAEAKLSKDAKKRFGLKDVVTRLYVAPTAQ